MESSIPLNEFLLTDVNALRGILDAVPHPIFVKDEETRFVIVNATMCALMNHTFDELIGKCDADFVPAEQADVFRGNDLRVLNTGEVNENEELFSDGEGRLRTIVTRKKRLVLPNNARLLVGCITDISDFRQAEALIRHHAEHDALTGLPNRRLFFETVEAALPRTARPGVAYTVLLIDLDRFKPVNDTYGHTAGDSVLCEVAERLKKVVRRGDVVARLGGDEFAIISQARIKGHADSAARLAARALAAIGRPIMVGNVAVDVGASIGISLCPENGVTAETLLHDADLAMYRGKHDGRGTFRFFEQRMDADMREQAALEAELRLAASNGDIVPFYQPLVEIPGGRVLGFEILARWNHPERGFVPPDIFIPITEKLGLISDLTFALLRTACRDALTWPGAPMLSLNVSPVQLADNLLPLQILAVLNEVGFPPGRLEIEITENALVADIEAAKAILASFQSLGIKVSLDDFGTGYSSLQHLRELPFDKIKIDRSFVQTMQENPESAKIISAILGLARSLGLPTTAEGIENADVMQRVADDGCEYGQGYYFGKAVPAAEIASLLEGQSGRLPLQAAG